jgi:hypothetical protein
MDHGRVLEKKFVQIQVTVVLPPGLTWLDIYAYPRGE